MLQTCHTWYSVGGDRYSPPGSLPCPTHGGAQSVNGVRCGSLPSPSIFPLGKRCRMLLTGRRYSNSCTCLGIGGLGWGGGGASATPVPPHVGTLYGTKGTPPPDPCHNRGRGLSGSAVPGRFAPPPPLHPESVGICIVPPKRVAWC